MRNDLASFGDFRCAHCRNLVSAAHILSGVNNRNHCPYCLWSCHLDLFTAGDRLSACKGRMKPIGLTVKKSRNKYRLEVRGELMLIHQCLDCDAVSINRIAADDDPESILSVFQNSILYNPELYSLCERYDIVMLQPEQREILFLQLYGQRM